MNAPVIAAAYRFTLDDVIRMIEAGIIDDDARVELIDGVLLEMPAEHAPHIRLKTALARWLITRLDESVNVVIDATLRLSDHDAPDPDIYLYPASVALEELSASDVGLVIEIAGTSLSRDLGAKAQLYAAHGVREYWVIEVQTLAVTVHRSPGPGGYGDIVSRSPDDELIALSYPQAPLVLSRLPLPL